MDIFDFDQKISESLIKNSSLRKQITELPSPTLLIDEILMTHKGLSTSQFVPKPYLLQLYVEAYHVLFFYYKKSVNHH